MKKLVLFLAFSFVFGTAFASVLGDAAALLKPGEWVEVSTNLPTTTYFKDAAGPCILNYSDDAVWYPDSQWIMFSGSDHGGTVNPGAFIIYKVESDTWEKRAKGTRNDFSHAYSFNTINPATGIYYHYDHSGGNVLQYNTTTDAWSVYFPFPAETTPTGMLEYFPEAGKLIFFGNSQTYIRYWDTTSSSWHSLGGLDSVGPLHPLGRYNPKHKNIMIGFGEIYDGGSGIPVHGVYLLDSNLQKIRVSNVPDVHIAHPYGVMTCDPASGDFLLMGFDNSFLAYDPVDDEWRKLPPPTVPLFNSSGKPLFVVSTPIPELGVTVFLRGNSTDYTSHVYLYKHDPVEPESCSVTASAGTGGTISPVGTTSVAFRDSVTYQIVADSGFFVDEVFVDGKKMGQMSSYTFKDLNFNHTINAVFDHETYIEQGDSLIIDNTEKKLVASSVTGVTTTAGAYGSNCEWVSWSGYQIWELRLPLGRYDIYVWHPVTGGDSDCEYALTQGGTSHVLSHFNQANLVQGWNKLYTDKEITSQSFTLKFSSISHDNYMYLDAVKFVRLDTGSTEVELLSDATEDVSATVSPNPFNPFCSISITLAKASYLTLDVHSLDGRLIKKITQRKMQAGVHHFTWKGNTETGDHAASGTYVMRLTVGGKTFLSKAVLLK